MKCTAGHFVAHCDIKPANILLEPVEAYPNRQFLRAIITDFGIAKILDAHMLAVKAFEIKNLNGRYAGPELLLAFRGMSPKPLSVQEILAGDVYALAVTLYETPATSMAISFHNSKTSWNLNSC
jgi:serine/threonine protein kinase